MPQQKQRLRLMRRHRMSSASEAHAQMRANRHPGMLVAARICLLIALLDDGVEAQQTNFTTCDGCLECNDCGWCADNGVCVVLSSPGPSAASCNVWIWERYYCQFTPSPPPPPHPPTPPAPPQPPPAPPSPPYDPPSPACPPCSPPPPSPPASPPFNPPPPLSPPHSPPPPPTRPSECSGGVCHVFCASELEVKLNDATVTHIDVGSMQLQLDQELVISQNVTIRGTGAVLDAAASSDDPRRVISIALGVHAQLEGLHIRGGYTTNSQGGGGILNEGALNLSKCNITNNGGVYLGGGVCNARSGTLTMLDCVISHNAAVSYGGGLYNEGTMVLNGCVVSGNAVHEIAAYTGGGGGGVANYGVGNHSVAPTLQMTQCVVSGNTALGFGGGLYNSYGAITLFECIISGNSVEEKYGGGVFNEVGSFAAHELHMFNNSAWRGGGLYCNGDCELVDSSLEMNVANAPNFSGCNLYNNKNVSFYNVTVPVTPACPSGSGRSLFNGANLTYVLPAPRGFHLSGVFLCGEQQCIDPSKWQDSSPTTETCPVQSCDATQFDGRNITSIPQGPLDFDIPTRCERGFFANSTNARAQNSSLCSGLCVKGHYCPDSPTLEPVACPVGHYLPSEGARSNASCQRCLPGTYTEKTGQESCTPCPPGTYSEDLGSTACPLCPLGGFCGATGASTVRQTFQACPDGYIGEMQGLVNKSQCAWCPDGHWCARGTKIACSVGSFTIQSEMRGSLDACRPCPLNMTTLANASGSPMDCVCANGFYRETPRDTTCVSCPVGFACNRTGSTTNLVQVAGHFWRPSAHATSAKRCHYQTCAGGASTNLSYANSEPSTCIPDLGVAGAFCALCIDAQSFFDRAKCRACSASVLYACVILALVSMLAFSLYMSRHLRCWQRPLDFSRRVSLRSKLKISIGFYQIVSQLSEVYDFTYPAQYENVIHFFRITNLHLSSWVPGLHSACLGLPRLLDQLLFATLVPIGVVAAAFIITAWQRKSPLSALPFVLYWTFLVYPSVSSRGFRGLATCTCFLNLDGSQTCFLRDDLAERCTFGHRPWPHPTIIVAAWLAIVLYGIGVPLLYAVLLRWRQGPIGEAVHFLVVDYEPRARWWELVEVFKKLLFTGFLALLEPGSLTQIYVAVAASFAVFALQMYVAPYQRAGDNLLAMFSNVALTFTLLGTLGLEMAANLNDVDNVASSGVLIAVLVAAALVVVIVAATMFLNDLRMAYSEPRVLWQSDRSIVTPQMLPHGSFHAFISHQWGHGQDVARIIKARLRQLVPGFKVFLDVDDLRDTDSLEAYIEVSDAVIVFLAGSFSTDGQQSDYFRSSNCLKEFRHAVTTGKRLVLVLETDAQHGGVTMETHRSACPAELREAFAALPVIPWHRMGAFQLVTLRQILRAVLSERPGDAMVFPAPRLSLAPCRVYASPHNPGADEIASRLAATRGISTSVEGGGDVFLLLLNGTTWRRRELQDEVEAALQLGQRILLVHEQRTNRGSVPFDHFFEQEGDRPVTPQVLRDLGIYDSLAAPLYEGEHGEASIQMLLSMLPTRTPSSYFDLSRANWLPRKTRATVKDEAPILLLEMADTRRV